MGLFYLLHVILLPYVARSFYTLANQDVKKESDNDIIYCHFCGFEIGDTSQIVYIPSDGARYVENRNISGKSVTVQTLENPFKYFFDVVTTYKANCLEDGLNMRADSWYPGYSWRVCKCPHCKYHLGWAFEEAINNNLEDTDSKIDTKPFYALILQALYGSVANSTVKLVQSEILQNTGASNESLPLFLDTPIEIKKPEIPTSPETKHTSSTKIDETTPSANTTEDTIVILKKRARNVTSNETNAAIGTRNVTAAE